VYGSHEASLATLQRQVSLDAVTVIVLLAENALNTRWPGVTVNRHVPTTSMERVPTTEFMFAVTSACPTPPAVIKPEFETVTLAGFELFQSAVVVKSLLEPSL
jgi:hypothetical protein